MMKWITILCSVIGTVMGTPHLDHKYTVAYGNPKAPIQIVEYLSFGCRACIQLFSEEFEGIRSTYIDTGDVYWVFHPHPVDLITVQAMVCLEKLSEHQKRVFFEGVVLESVQSTQVEMLTLLKAAMKVLKVNHADLTDSAALQATEAFKAAFAYQQSKPPFSGTPTIEINGRVVDEFPTRQCIDQLIQEQKGQR